MIKIITSWKQAADLIDQEVHIVDLHALMGDEGRKAPQWQVARAHSQAIAEFFELKDTQEYAEWLSKK
jgi:hypothetical protein